jgi:hypothetical protein
VRATTYFVPLLEPPEWRRDWVEVADRPEPWRV